ncbi:hypothetical protein, conserved [Eimeria tenella]|uniref:Uncharacterized protein n=1 Tax=Eimeria tenella TaxID=5802 RepID=U6KWJ2_EIMTE|nr:hypothetical protein, conserved [Eimeria tenella]CDJ42341.1 hypothetical protein, conserved [Eimeria tenella]|eukprot:XP_013233091.1 hypothetical protein, conserved [Eimeria tenella]
MGEISGPQVPQPRQSLLQLRALRNTTSYKLEELSVLRKEADVLEQKRRSILRETAAIRADQRAAAAAAIRLVHANATRETERRALEMEVLALKSELSLQKKELEEMETAWKRRK